MSSEHLREIQLRQWRNHELGPVQAQDVDKHLASCGACKEKAQSLDLEQKAFEARIPFERFSAGVERAARHPVRSAIVPKLPRVAMALAASLMVMLVAGPILKSLRPENRLKGGTDVVFRIAAQPGDVQRDASAEGLDALSPGDRVRVGIRPSGYHFALVLAVDPHGVIEPVYYNGKFSMQLTQSDAVEYLPDSLEFTGSGTHLLVVALSENAIKVEEGIEAVEAAIKRGSPVDGPGLDAINLPGQQFVHRFFTP